MNSTSARSLASHRSRRMHRLTSLAVFALAAFPFAAIAEARFAAPATQPGVSTTPIVRPYVEPTPLHLPSEEPLDTISIKGKTYTINKLSEATRGIAEARKQPGWAGLYQHADATAAITLISKAAGGRVSSDRLVVEDCTFVIDFTEGDFEQWEPMRAAIYVEGFKEVVVRNCVFISKARGRDPLRKVVGSIVAYDCLNLKVDNCYFEGRTTGWRGHVLAFCCGPTHISNVEVNGRGDAAGGIWLATGIGEGKLGWMHADKPELMIYPAGPALIENSFIHDQKGKENSDGIYVQSIHPFLIRNCRVDNWGDDSLIDVGFRDTAPNKYDGETLVNHGYIGVVERSEFTRGWIKSSVGLGGGLVFRGNRVGEGAWMFPYVFDGGSWWVVGNRFDPLTGVIVSGKNAQTDGWTPKEGMFIRGSQMKLFSNEFATRDGAAPTKPLFVAGAKPGPLGEAIRSDYNHYAMQLPKVWASDVAGDITSIEEWRRATKNDVNSIVGAGSLADLRAAPIDLPGGITFTPGAVTTGLTGPVGLSDSAVAARAKLWSAKVAAELAQLSAVVEAESLADVHGTATAKHEKRNWASGGSYVAIVAAERGHTWGGTLQSTLNGRYRVAAGIANSKGGTWKLAIDGQDVGTAALPVKRGTVEFGDAVLTSGPHLIELTLVDGEGAASVDQFSFERADILEREAVQTKERDARRAAERERRAQLDARTTRIDLTQAKVAVAGGREGVYGTPPDTYRLWTPDAAGASITIEFDVAEAGEYAIEISLAKQQDKATLVVAIDDQTVANAVATSSPLRLGRSTLTTGIHRLKLQLVASKGAPKIRLNELKLIPVDAENAPR
jgi:hypothetical protein